MNYGTKITISAIFTAIFAWVLYYLALPALTPASPGFWWYCIAVVVCFAICATKSGWEDEIMLPAL